ncbi:hypothetical protein NDN08_005706 [Rhodosorus marinus]|uniref:116 kDa U5 small nuclear ribonucleoprotein component n=1 Tax=Rhodosorus marinus TaxID=101924 RepID=A0AAV8V4V0_9RHOD|nr:hypothetical protein NDN08_005706 [Rhodosorus marinus]
MDEELYDEFGNYVGPEMSSSSEDEEQRVDELGGDEEEEEGDGVGREDRMEEVADVDDVEEDAGNAIVLAEDKKYYPTAEEVFGEGTEALVEEEDAQPITEPIIAPVKERKIDLVDGFDVENIRPLYDEEYLAGAVLSNPDLIRNVAVVGHLHHGKTTLMDLLMEKTHETDWPTDREVLYTDTRKDEVKRGLSTKMMPVTLLLPDMNEKSHGINLIDCPGHLCFFDETVAAMQMCDGVIVVVDAAEGVLTGTELAIQAAVSRHLAITVVITKVDRLILELRLPPRDAYHKLKYTIDQFNEVLSNTPGGSAYKISPELGNVCFSSCLGRWLCSLEDVASMYLNDFPDCPIPAKALALRLWGDVWYDKKKLTFTKKTPPADEESGEPPARSFIEFVLDPIYKLYSMIVADDVDILTKKMVHLGIMQHLRRSDLRLDVKPLFKICLGTFFDGATRSLGEMLSKHVPSPVDGNKAKVERLYTGPLDSEIAVSMSESQVSAPLVAMTTKLLSTTDAESFFVVARIMSGKLTTSTPVRVLGEGYNPDFDDEDQAHASVGTIYLSVGRYRTEVTAATVGQIVLVEGISESIIKSATIVEEAGVGEETYIFRPLSSSLKTGPTAAVVRIAIEPLRPSELPKMVEGLRKCAKSYPSLQTRVEESGEHVLLGTGELQLDCVLADLRTVYGDIEIKVSDPCVPFTETVMETSSLKCFAETPNKANKLTMIAEPLEEGLAEHLESGKLGDFDSASLSSKSQVQSTLRSEFGWDVLAARSLWSFGPDSRSGPNCLVDDVLPGGTTDKTLMAHAKDSIVQGFQWSTREGPLCDEPVRGVKYRIMEAMISEDPIQRSVAQIIPTARRVAYSAFLTASPRLMEPVYSAEVMCSADNVEAVYNILARRRGFVEQDAPVVGTPTFLIKATIPVLDSFGFESDLRLFTQGQAFCLQWFNHWSMMPGDPLDKDIHLVPLQPSPQNALARECMVKTRRRKGMSEDVSIGKYFDDPLLLELAQQDINA